MDKFLDAYIQTKLNQEDISHLDSPVTCNEIEAVIKSPPTKSIPVPDGFMAEFYQNFKELTPILIKFFQEIEREGTLPKLFYEAVITLIPKPNKVVTRKEIYRPISLMNIVQIFSVEFNNTSKRSYKMTKAVSFQGCISAIQHINRSKGKNCMILSIDAEKAFDKI
jgi:hypothetical protein